MASTLGGATADRRRRRQPSPVRKEQNPLRGSDLPTVADVATVCDLVLPCRDEAAALPGLLARVPPGFSVIVVDNGSGDGTAEVARRLGATVVEEPVPGYGAAVHAGPAGGHQRPRRVHGRRRLVRRPPTCCRCSRRSAPGGADLAVGRRRPVARGVWPWHARLGNGLVVWWLRRRIGMAAHDIAPMRVCRREALLALDVRDRRFGYPVELLQKATAAGWRVAERDVAYHPRAEGTRSKVSGSVRGTVRAARDFWRVLS